MHERSKIKLARVQYIPKNLEPGILYVSEEFEVAVHLCACGCGLKVCTPLTPTEWRFTDSENGPSLFPSVGNWEFPCRSHYWFQNGQIFWGEDWTPAQIEAGRRSEEERSRAYFASLERQRHSQRQRENRFRRFWRWIKSFFE